MFICSPQFAIETHTYALMKGQNVHMEMELKAKKHNTWYNISTLTILLFTIYN